MTQQRPPIDLQPSRRDGTLAHAHRLIDGGEIAAAIGLLDAAVCRAPRDGAALALLGTLLVRLGEDEAAVSVLKRATAEITDDAELWQTLAGAAQRCRYGDAARWCLDRAIAMAPSPQRWLQRGKISQELQRFDEATEDFRRVLSLPHHPAVGREANESLAATLSVIGDPQSAANILDTLIAQTADAADAGLLQHRVNIANYLPHSPATQRQLLQAWNRKIVAVDFMPAPHPNPPVVNRALRIGYVSADFRFHPVAFFIAAILEKHRRPYFEVFCYAANKADEMTEVLRQHADHWRGIGRLDDAELARQIRDDRIDILVDLSGHTAGNRLGAFARKPAPVQISYLGYPGPTGLSTIDFRLSDRLADPVQHDECAAGPGSETVLQLPDGFHCYRPPQRSPERSFTPLLANGFVTFGCFNNLAKIGPDALDAWADILRQVADSRLHMKSLGLASVAARTRILDHFRRHGIAGERIVFIDYAAEPEQHLRHYLQVDIGLDSFPYNGTTTTCEALWMSTPIVTWLGAHHPARVGGSLLTAAGLTELIGQHPADYVHRAVALAHAPERLQQAHRTLRQRLLDSPLCDEPGFVGKLEQAYRMAWTAWCNAETS